MAAAHWSDVWDVFCTVVGQEPAPLCIAIWLGIALVAVMALEGLHASLFPSRFLQRRRLASPLPRPAPENPPRPWLDVQQN